jgi:hypothetical protein
MKKLVPLLALGAVGLLVVACAKKDDKALSEASTVDTSAIPDANGVPPPVETVLPAESSTQVAPAVGTGPGDQGDTTGPVPPSNPPAVNPQATPAQ